MQHQYFVTNTVNKKKPLTWFTMNTVFLIISISIIKSKPLTWFTMNTVFLIISIGIIKN